MADRLDSLFPVLVGLYLRRVDAGAHNNSHSAKGLRQVSLIPRLLEKPAGMAKHAPANDRSSRSQGEIRDPGLHFVYRPTGTIHRKRSLSSGFDGFNQANQTTSPTTTTRTSIHGVSKKFHHPSHHRAIARETRKDHQSAICEYTQNRQLVSMPMGENAFPPAKNMLLQGLAISIKINLKGL